ncbi:MAG: hypothetical protein ACI828_001652, partial [Flavobacteriales bacterium]
LSQVSQEVPKSKVKAGIAVKSNNTKTYFIVFSFKDTLSRKRKPWYY